MKVHATTGAPVVVPDELHLEVVGPEAPLAGVAIDHHVVEQVVVPAALPDLPGA